MNEWMNEWMSEEEDVVNKYLYQNRNITKKND
jgi:hypothetical protein